MSWTNMLFEYKKKSIWIFHPKGMLDLRAGTDDFESKTSLLMA